MQSPVQKIVSPLRSPDRFEKLKSWMKAYDEESKSLEQPPPGILKSDEKMASRNGTS
jgi:hypothetical protein